MGCCSSFDVYDLENVKKYRRQFESLQLTRREVNKLYRIFRKADVDGSGSIALIELLCHVDVERTAFTERVFSIFDEDGSGEIDFREFVLALWNYCTLSRATLDLFAFDLYDRDSSGEMSTREVQRMLKDIYGKAANTNHHARAIAADLKAMEKDGEINAEQFCKFAKTHHALLFPAFEMQQLLQRKTLGTAFWYRNSERRIEVSKGRFIPVAKFMELHLNKTLLNQTLSGPAVVTAEVRQDAKIALSVTETKQMRVLQTQLKKEEESQKGVAQDYVVMPFDEEHPNQKPLHSHQHKVGNQTARKTELDLVHEQMNNSQTAKVWSTKDEHGHSVASAAAAASSVPARRRSSVSVVPDLSSVKTATNVVIELPDDGNPSAKLPLFQDFSSKSNNSDGGGGHNRKRRHSVDGNPSALASLKTSNLGKIEESSVSQSTYQKSGVPPTQELKPLVTPKPKPVSVKEANDHYLNAFKPPSEKAKDEAAVLDQPVDAAAVAKKGANAGKRRRSLG